MNEAAWWELLKKELKTDDVTRILARPAPEGFRVDVLAQKSPVWLDGHFHRAALSHTFTRSEDVRWSELPKLVAQGIWDFILDPFLLGWDAAQLKQELALAAPVLKSCHARLWVADAPSQLPEGAFPVLSGQDVQVIGAHAAQELGVVLARLIDWAQTENPGQIAAAVYMDREFFKSIAKMRALKALTEAALRELGCEEYLKKITWLGRVSWRDFSAFDQSSNILRNANAVAASYLSGVAVVESLPADLLLVTASREQSLRLATTTQLVLQNESELGEVVDPASGCFALENLTQQLGEAAWQVMQTLKQATHSDYVKLLSPEIQRHWDEVQKKVRTRKLVQAGVNDFALVGESVQLHPRWQRKDHVRLGRAFEELRLSVGTNKPRVHLRVVGDAAALQARFNFAKNFFEILGLECSDQVFATVEEALKVAHAAPVQVWVSADDVHASLRPTGERCYLAGKTTVADCYNIFSGMDVWQELQELSVWWRAHK